MLTIKTNHKYRPLLSWEDLTPNEQAEFDFDNKESSSYFRYKKWTYCLGDFTRTSGELATFGWDGQHGDSFFSGIVIKFCRIDFMKLIAGTYLC